MAQDIEPKVVWKHTFFIAILMCLAFIGIDWIHFFIFGTKFTYIINPMSPTNVFDFFFYLFVFAGMGFLIGLIVNFETKDVVVAGFLGPFIFLAVNFFILFVILHIYPPYGAQLIPHHQWIWGIFPDWLVIFPEVIQHFVLMYLLWGFLMFFILAFPFILAFSFSGHTIRVMMGWNWPK